MKLGGVLGLPGGGSPSFVELVEAGWTRRREYDIAPAGVMGAVGRLPIHGGWSWQLAGRVVAVASAAARLGPAFVELRSG